MSRYVIVQDEKGFVGFSVVDSKKASEDNASSAVMATFPFGATAAETGESAQRAQTLADLLNNQTAVIKQLGSTITEIIDLAKYGPSSDPDHCIRYLEQIEQTATNAIGLAAPYVP